MRQIKFRGKDTNGKWLYGGIVQAYFDSGKESLIVSSQDLSLVHVSPETVGQFTGLQDKKGKPIYEGDIVRLDDESHGKYWRFAVVKYNPDLCFDCAPMLAFDGVKNGDNGCFHYAQFAYKDTGKYLEVVGNIHDDTKKFIITE